MDSPAPGLKFWGTRRGLPRPDSNFLKYGGNTRCMELRNNGRERIVFDAGTGIAGLGRELLETPANVHVFLSQFYWDSIQGLPFFAPLYRPDFEITFYAAATAETVRSYLAGQMRPPYFPVPFGAVASQIRFVDVTSEVVNIGGIAVCRSGQDGFRAEIDDAIVIYSPVAGVQILNERAEVGQFLLFPHGPDDHDESVASMERRAQEGFANTTAAREGSTVWLNLAERAAASR